MKHIKVSQDMIAIGFNNGTIQIYGSKIIEGKLELLHNFSFHRSAITNIHFFENNT